jgi:hypothetical protein
MPLMRQARATGTSHHEKSQVMDLIKAKGDQAIM